MKEAILHLAALGDGNILIRLVPRGPRILDLPDNVHAVNHLAKDDVLFVQEGGGSGGDEELAAVCVWAGVLYMSAEAREESEREEKRREEKRTYSHAQQAGLIMLDVEVLVCELGGPVYGGAPCAVSVDEVSALDHEVFDL